MSIVHSLSEADIPADSVTQDDLTDAVHINAGVVKSGSKGGKGPDDSNGDGPGAGGGGGGPDSPPSFPFSFRSYEVYVPGERTPRIAKPYAPGDKSQVNISSGNMFLGRKMGGGTRDQIYGTRQYGSGYSEAGITIDRGVAGRNFPFWFWPIAWGGPTSNRNSAYLHTNEYGAPDNTSRPGGIMMTAEFAFLFSSSASPSTFHFTSDNVTVQSMIHDVFECVVSLDIVPIQYNPSSPTAPKPEQAVQYYRGSTAVLTYHGYNNTSIFQANGTKDTPLPVDVDKSFLNCLNDTIGKAILVVDNTSSGQVYSSSNGPVTLAYLMWVLVGMILM